MSPLKTVPRSWLLFSAVILMELEYRRVAPQPVGEFITMTYKPIVVNSFEEMMEHTKGAPGRIVVLNQKMLRGKPGQPKMIYRIVLKNEEEGDNIKENPVNEIAGNDFDNNESDRIENENCCNDELIGDDDFEDDENNAYSDWQEKFGNADVQDVRSRR